jgi:superfamily II DNA/RNA helicase
MEGKDVIGIANTGTGKTAAFLLPLIDKVFHDNHERVLIVAPTRELALQIVEEFVGFSRGTGLMATLCIGGANIVMQEKKLQRQPQFVIGTPGRLKDLIQRRSLNLSQFHNIVLDEVDRMVDIGFIKDIQYLISLLPQQRHSLFFSATITDKVRDILNQFVHNPVTISVKQQETASSVDQDIIRVKDKLQKVEMLHDLLIQDGFNKVLVFGRTKWGIEKLTKQLIDRGFKAASIHGNKSQNQRQRALDQFKSNQLQVLLATDVASRGLDIENVTHVINYDEPASYEDYVHRIGRTGRANKKGFALTFVE